MANNLSTSDLQLIEGNTVSDSSQSANTLSATSNYYNIVYTDEEMEDLYDDDFITEDKITLSFTTESEDVFMFNWNVFYLGTSSKFFKPGLKNQAKNI